MVPVTGEVVVPPFDSDPPVVALINDPPIETPLPFAAVPLLLEAG